MLPKHPGFQKAPGLQICQYSGQKIPFLCWKDGSVSEVLPLQTLGSSLDEPEFIPRSHEKSWTQQYMLVIPGGQADTLRLSAQPSQIGR